MPTFFPGTQKAHSVTKTGGPVPVESSKMSSKHSTAKPGKNTKISRDELPPLGRQYHRDGEVASQPDTVYAQSTYSRRHTQDSPNTPSPSQWHANEGIQSQSQYERPPERREEPQYQQFGLHEDTDRLGSAFNLLNLPDVDIYDHCLLLRKHGMMLRLDRETARIMVQQGSMDSDNSTSCNHNKPTDAHNPTRKEKQEINHAITFVLRRGIEIDMPAFEIRPVIQCNHCSEDFSTPDEKYRHCDEARNYCNRCREGFPCPQLLQDHMRDGHKKYANRDSAYSSGHNQGH